MRGVRNFSHQIAFIDTDREVPVSEVKAGVDRVSLYVMALAFFTTPTPLPAPRPLTEADAVDIWIARWLRIRHSDLVRRYGCDPRRLYEIWEEVRFAGTRDKALEVFAARYPSLIDRVDYGPHRRISHGPHADQLALFD